jgi:hypothetical protein
MTEPSTDVKVIALHPSDAVAVPSAPVISPAVGLQPKFRVVPPVVITGGVLSSVHVAVLAAVDVLPQASCAVHVLVCDREQLVLITAPSLGVIVVAPHPSLAVAVPSAQ